MPKLLNNISTACSKLRIIKRAMNATKKAMNIKSDYAQVLLKGNAYDNIGMFKEAVKSYKQAVRLEPDNSEAYYNLGNAYGRLGMFKEAVKSYRDAVRVNPDDAKAHYGLGKAYGKLGNYKAAISAIRRAIKLRPSNSGAYKNLGVFYGMLGMYKDAKESLDQALLIEPTNAHARYNRAIVCLELHERDFALKEYNVLKDIAPKTADKLSKILQK